MVDLSASLTALRRDGHTVRVYMGVFKGAIVLAGAVSATPSTYPVTSIAYTTSTGSSASVKRGMRVLVKTSAGVLKGVARVRATGTLDATHLPVREISKGTIKIASGDLIEVRSIMQPGDKLVDQTSAFKPDGLAYSAQNGTIPPIACSGGPFILFTDAGQSYATWTPPGSLSYTVDSGSAGTVSHSWTASTATGTTTSSSATPTFTFPAGEHFIVHTVTDSSNSATWTQYISGIVDDGSLTYLHEILIESMEGSEDSGWSATVQAFADADLDDMPDGTLVGLVVREVINGVEQSLGNAVTGKSADKLFGYLRRDTSRGDGDNDELRFEIISPLQYYAETLGLSKVGISDSTPNNWSQIQSLGVRRMILQILRWYTWLTESWDVIFHSSYSDALYARFYIQKQDAISQVRELTDGRDARLVCDRTGRFEIQQRLELIALASRSGQTTTLPLTPDDLIDYDFTRDHRRPIADYHSRGFTAGSSNNSPVFAVWPGQAPGEGTDSQTDERLIVDSTTDHYARNGRRGAAKDGWFVDANDAGHFAPEGTITLPGSYDVFDFYAEWVGFTYTLPLRGVVLGDFRWLVKSISVEYAGDGTAKVTLGIKAETNGNPGVDDTPPNEASSGLGSFTLPDDYTDIVLPPLIPITDSIPPATLATLALIGENGIAPTANFGSGLSVLYTFISWVTMGVSGTVLQWCPHGFAPGKGWVVTSTSIYYVTLATHTAVLKYTFDVASDKRSADANYLLTGAPNHFVVVSDYSDGVKATYTTNNSVFTEVPVTTFAASFTSNPGCYVSSITLGKVITSANSAFGVSAGYVSPDYGATWSPLASPDLFSGIALAQHIHVPLDDNAAESIMYYAVATGADVQFTYRSTGLTQDDVSPAITGNKYSPIASRNTIDSFVGDRQKVAMVGERDAGSFVAMAAFISSDAGDTWTTVEAATTIRRVAFSGNDANTLYWFGVSNRIDLSTDFGVTLVSQTGNLGSFSLGEIIGVAGM